MRFSSAVLFLACANCGSCQEWLRPKALSPGDTIMVVAPARTPEAHKIRPAVKRLEALGFRVIAPSGIYSRSGYLAGSDERRATELMTAFANPEVDAVFAATGGFGTTRLLDRLNYDVIRNNPKVLLGFSDITGLHLAINRKAHLITFHGPNLDSGSGERNELTAFSKHWLEQALLKTENENRDGYSIRPMNFQLQPEQLFTAEQFETTCQLNPPVVVVAGKARGRLTGGNLSLVTSLMGTPYEIETRGKIVYLEDIGEAPYRVDRMLSSLRLAGKLDDVAGVLLGTFTDRFDQGSVQSGAERQRCASFVFRGCRLSSVEWLSRRPSRL